MEFPLLDDWDLAIQQLQRLEVHPLGWGDVNIQHTESIILFPELVVLTLVRTTGYHVLNFIYLSYLFQAGCLLILYRFFLLVAPAGRWTPLDFAPVAIFFLSWRQSEGLLWGIHLLNTMALFFSLLALYSCVRAAHFPRFLPMAIASAWIASFTMAGGLLVWVAGGAYLAWAARRYLLVWAAAGIACSGCFFADRVSYAEDWPTGAGYVLSHPAAAVHYCLNYLAAPFTHDAGAGPWTGAIVVVLAAIAVYWAVRDRAAREAAAPGLLLIGLVALALGPLLGRRLGMGPEQALASRYVTFSSLAPIGIYFCLLALLRRRPAARYLMAALAVLFVAGTFDGYSKGIAEGRESRKYDLDCAAVVRHYRTVAPEDLECAYPDPRVVLERAPFLERRHFSLFGER